MCYVMSMLRQVFSVLIRSHYEDRVFVTLELAEKGYCGKDEYMCPNDGYVYIHNSELLVGRLGKGFAALNTSKEQIYPFPWGSVYALILTAMLSTHNRHPRGLQEGPVLSTVTQRRLRGGSESNEQTGSSER